MKEKNPNIFIFDIQYDLIFLTAGACFFFLGVTFWENISKELRPLCPLRTKNNIINIYFLNHLMTSSLLIHSPFSGSSLSISVLFKFSFHILLFDLVIFRFRVNMMSILSFISVFIISVAAQEPQHHHPNKSNDYSNKQ